MCGDPTRCVQAQSLLLLGEHSGIWGGQSEMLKREIVDKSKFNSAADLPYQLRLADFEMAFNDFFYDVNKLLVERGLRRLDDTLRPAAVSGIISDMLTASLAKHARALVENRHFNGHPDLIVQGNIQTIRSNQAATAWKSRAHARKEVL